MHVFTLNRWVVTRLKVNSKVPPKTLEHYMLNARSLLKHMKVFPPGSCLLSKLRIKGLIGYFDSLIKSNQRGKSEQQHKRKQEKLLMRHLPEDLKKCHVACLDKIPKLLGESLSNLTHF